jgi:protein TonB
MRTYTLVLSIVVHAGIVAALVISPALATDVLPEVQRTTAFILVRPEMPAQPPPPVQRRAAPPSTAAAPVVEPEGVEPEPPEVFEPAALVVGVIPWFGVPAGEAIVGGGPLPPASPPEAKGPVRIGGVVRPPAKIRHVAPIYPPIALAARKEGLVILEALVGEDGEVREVRVLRSDALFDDAAVQAVRQWKFTPTRLNGEPVPVVMTVTVGFSLRR